GIRKVLGSSESRLISLLSKDLLILVFIANIISWPLAWYVMNQWLENFAYKIGLEINIFALSGLLALVIAAITVSFQTIRSARANPVDSLRYE
ncbi:MAG: ABC transporter permease, partial [bacterium]|nr:ABC transporter permease [bacterium]